MIRASQILEQITSVLFESITPETIDKWEREYFNFALAAPRIRDGAELKEVATSFGKWIDSFVLFLSQNLLGLDTKSKNYLRHETYIKESIHELKYEFRASLFPVRLADFLIAHKTTKEFASFIQDFLDDFGGGTYRVIGSNDSVNWDDFFESWSGAFEKGHLPFVYYQDVGKQLFKTIRVDLQKDGPIYDAHQEEVATIGSVKVFTYRAEDSNVQSEELKHLISGLKIALRKLQDHGLEKATQGAKVLLDRQSDEYDRSEQIRNYAASYVRSTDTIEVWYVRPELFGDFLHEFAHRYHERVMSQRQQKAWLDFCISNLVEIRSSDIDRMLSGLEAFGKTFDTLSREELLNGWKRQLEKSGVGDSIIEKFVALGNYIDGIMKHLYDDPEHIKPDIVWIIKKNLIQRYPGGVQLFKHPISHYGASHGEGETYAEVFRLYCEDKPISEIVRVEFERISGLK
jgi:hypothetical protein